MKKLSIFCLVIMVLLIGCEPLESETDPNTRISEIDGMTLLFVPEGTFEMGVDVGWKDDEPAHIVYLDAFWIDQTEVTNDQYRKCVQDGVCNEPSNTASYNDAVYANHPVVYVNWHEANDYCAWANRRLPTEAEWEKAARGTDARKYPWGDEEVDCSKANYKACKDWSRTSPVGYYPQAASPYGALDMSGNVWEWVSDWYIVDYYRKSPASNPQGPSSGDGRVLRSGSRYDLDATMQTVCRANSDPGRRYFSIGFRCARSEQLRYEEV